MLAVAGTGCGNKGGHGPAPGGITFFEGSFTDLQQEAAQQGKPFFVDFYADWCGPCKAMVKTTFSDTTVGNYVRQHYLAAQVDCEKGDGIKLCQKFDIAQYPTIIVFDAQGRPLEALIGYYDAPALLERLRALSPQANN